MRRSVPYVAAVALFVAYCFWIAGPYLRSIVVRDAAVTSWSNLATAPISGTVHFAPLAIGGRIGTDGLIATIRNEHISREAVDAAALRAALAASQYEHAESFLAEIESLEDDRRETKAHYARIFRHQLDIRIESVKSQIAIFEQRLAVMQEIASRKQRLAESGTGSINEADEVSLRVSEMKLAIDALTADLEYASQRRTAADNGIFIEATGDDPNWVLETRMELKLEKKKARLEQRLAEISLETAKAELRKAEADFARLSTANVKAAPGQLLWGKHAVTGMAVSEGAPVAEWLDCGDLLVDMPVSDAEASLIAPGDAAEVVLEGEKIIRSAQVLLVRGSASTLGRNELIALAKGRSPGVAQVLLTLDAAENDFETCPVGHAAYVDFPGVGVLDVVRARLRL